MIASARVALIRGIALAIGYAVAGAVVLALVVGSCAVLAEIGQGDAPMRPAPTVAPSEAPVAPSVTPSAEPSAPRRPVVLPSGPFDVPDDEIDCDELEEPSEVEQCEDEDE